MIQNLFYYEMCDLHLILGEMIILKNINKSDWSRWRLPITNNVGNTHLMIMLWQYYTAEADVIDICHYGSQLSMETLKKILFLMNGWTITDGQQWTDLCKFLWTFWAPRFRKINKNCQKFGDVLSWFFLWTMTMSKNAG